MKKLILGVVLGMILLGAGAVFAAESDSVAVNESPLAVQTAVGRKTAFSFELLGKGLLYGLYVDHAFLDRLSLGAGLSYWGIPFFFDMITVPFYSNFYILTGKHRPYASVGIDYMHMRVSFFNLFPVSGNFYIPFVSAGYEYRGDGLLLRAAPYAFYVNNKFIASGGLSVGVVF